MHSPAEQILEKAGKDLDAQEHEAEIARQKQALIGNINRAKHVIRGNIQIPAFASADGESMDVEVKRSGSHHGNGGDGIEFLISGKLVRGEAEHVAGFPMYKVTRNVPASDTMWPLPPRYEILVADQASETGFTPLALVGSKFSSTGKLTPDQQSQFQLSGFYVNPHGEAMLEEVQSILGMAADQAVHQSKQARSRHVAA